MRLDKRVAKVAIRSSFGRGFSRACCGLGARRLGAWTSRYTHYAPDVVPIPFVLSDGRAFTVRMRSDGGNDDTVFQLWCRGLKGYEYPLPQLYARLASEARVVLGAGANSGFYEVLAALAAPEAQVYAFEPFPPAIAALEGNVALNEVAGRVEVVKRAVSDATGAMQLFVPAKTHGDILERSASLNPDFRPDHSDVVDVQVTSLDAFCEEAGITKVDLIRADVESLEHKVLAGSSKILDTYRPFVVLEVLPGSDYATLNAICTAQGYVPYVLGGDELRQQSTVSTQGNDNQVLCPQERCEEFEGLANEAGLASD